MYRAIFVLLNVCWQPPEFIPSLTEHPICNIFNFSFVLDVITSRKMLEISIIHSNCVNSTLSILYSNERLYDVIDYINLFSFPALLCLHFPQNQSFLKFHWNICIFLKIINKNPSSIGWNSFIRTHSYILTFHGYHWLQSSVFPALFAFITFHTKLGNKRQKFIAISLFFCKIVNSNPNSIRMEHLYLWLLSF